MNHEDCDRIAAMAPALALGALDRDEARFVRAHLASCVGIHPEVRESVSLAAAIGGALPDEDLPSQALRSRLLGAVRSERSGRPTPPSARTAG